MFSNLGEEWFDDYWMNYGKITIQLLLLEKLAAYQRSERLAS